MGRTCYTVKMLTREQFRDAIRTRHEAAFDLQHAVVVEMERRITEQRDLSDLVSRSVDMLFVQGFKALTAVGELASVSLAEDAATIVRRLMELGVWAIYIARDSEEETRRERAGGYLASLWEEWPPELYDVIPEPDRKAWAAVAKSYPAIDSAGKRRRRPTVRELFDYAGHPQTYIEDYAHLSAISHGRPPALVHGYSRGRIAIHDDGEVSTLLVYGSSYGLVTFLVWLEHFDLESPEAQNLLSRVRDARNLGRDK
jgi:hypothetical protein